MLKTTVYLNEDEDEGLRRMAAETGKSKAELIREAVRAALGRGAKRKFHSMGVGRGGGGPTPTWDADDLYRESVTRADSS